MTAPQREIRRYSLPGSALWEILSRLDVVRAISGSMPSPAVITLSGTPLGWHEAADADRLCRAGEWNALPCKDFGLAVQGQVVGIF